MKRVYGAFLRLYRREYRDLFGPEDLSVFAQAAREQRARGRGVWVWFVVTELSGAVFSAAGHWVDRFSARRRARLSETPEIPCASRSGLFAAVREAQSRVDSNVQQMTHAIAN